VTSTATGSDPPPVYSRDEVILKGLTIVVLGVIVITAIICLTFVAVNTDRDLKVADTLTFAGVVLIASLGGLTWLDFRRRRRWHVELDHNGGARPGD
jgi:hypothetical protein